MTPTILQFHCGQHGTQDIPVTRATVAVTAFGCVLDPPCGCGPLYRGLPDDFWVTVWFRLGRPRPLSGEGLEALTDHHGTVRMPLDEGEVAATAEMLAERSCLVAVLERETV